MTPWNSIEDTDPRRFIENLRAIGCPEQTIRDIVTLRVCREFRSRLIEAQSEAARGLAFTRRADHGWEERQWQQQDFRDEMITTLESLFGQSWGSLTTSLLDSSESGPDALDSFSIEARRQIREVDKTFRRELDEVHPRHRADFDLEEAAAYRQLELQKREALAKILSPEELEEYLYRQSPAADYVRRNLPAANSESEYRAMVKLALDMEMSGTVDTLASRGGQVGDAYPDEPRKAVQDRKAAYDQALKDMLGEERIAEQQIEEQARAEAEKKDERAQSELRSFAMRAGLAESVGIGVEDADRFFNRMKELQPVLQPKFDEMEKRLTGTDEEKQKQMEAVMRPEYEKIAVEIIGEKGRELVAKMFEGN